MADFGGIGGIGARGGIVKFCPHCGKSGFDRLGYCDVCGLIVCESCGNVQHSHGVKKIIHDACLKDGADGTFSMIKFVK